MPVGWRLLNPTSAMTSVIALPIRRRVAAVGARLASKAKSRAAVSAEMASSVVGGVVGVADAAVAEVVVERVKAQARPSVSRVVEVPSLVKVVNTVAR